MTQIRIQNGPHLWLSMYLVCFLYFGVYNVLFWYNTCFTLFSEVVGDIISFTFYMDNVGLALDMLLP